MIFNQITFGIQLWKSHIKLELYHHKEHCFPFGLICRPHILDKKCGKLFLNTTMRFNLDDLNANINEIYMVAR